MGKNLLVGVNGTARKAKKIYLGIDGKARKVKKIYLGVDGKARLVYSESNLINDITFVSQAETVYAVESGTSIKHSQHTLSFTFTPTDAWENIKVTVTSLLHNYSKSVQQTDPNNDDEVVTYTYYLDEYMTLEFDGYQANADGTLTVFIKTAPTGKGYFLLTTYYTDYEPLATVKISTSNGSQTKSVLFDFAASGSTWYAVNQMYYKVQNKRWE